MSENKSIEKTRELTEADSIRSRAASRNRMALLLVMWRPNGASLKVPSHEQAIQRTMDGEDNEQDHRA
jgi:hypothetical protein